MTDGRRCKGRCPRASEPPMTRLHRRHRAVLLALIVGAAAAATFTVGGAGATPLSDQQAQAAALEAQINANAVELDALNERVIARQHPLPQPSATTADP